MLLRFRITNHTSIREEQELSLVAVPGRGAPRPRAAQLPPTVRVAGIYGANASGKSNVLEAMWWMQHVIAASHAQWAPGQPIPRRPFELDDESFSRPTGCEVDFVHDGTRYSYGFQVDDEVVRSEWLLSFPSGRPVKVFERTGPEEYTFGRSLTGEKEQIRRLTRPNSLYLSAATANNHHLLGGIRDRLVHQIKFAHQNEDEEIDRVRYTVGLLRKKAEREQAVRLLAMADLGISGVHIGKKPVTDDQVAALRRHFSVMGGGRPEYLVEDRDLRKSLREAVELVHESSGERAGRRLPLDDESAGTRAWLALVGPLLWTLRSGHVLVIDEIDSSLHPILTSTMIRMFKDPEVNRREAQLIFASHDTTLLSTMLADDLLARDEVWFTEKDTSGVTSLFSLSEFHPRKGESVERGYLQGRYGAVPYVRYDEVRETFAEIWRREELGTVR